MNDYNSESYFFPPTTHSFVSGIAAPTPHLESSPQPGRVGSGAENYTSHVFDHSRHGSVELMYQHPAPDEPFPYAQSTCTRTSLDRAPTNECESGLDHSEECLSFSPPTSNYSLLDESYQKVDILLSAQLTGLFSREGQLSDYLAPEHGGSAPFNSPVLICYRRNRISIGGHLAIPQGLRFVQTAQGQQLPIVSQELVLSAFESLDDGHGGRLVPTLVQRDGPPTSAADSDGEGSGPQPIPLTQESAEEASHDQEFNIFPFDWKKLQFRRATVNNGKGPDRQKFFFVSIKILANLADGQKVSICEVSSNPIIVRGRGPQNFAKAPASPEHGRIYRSKSLNATLDGRLRKPDRRSTRHSLLRQSLSRKPMAGAAVSSTALQALAAYESSTAQQSTPSLTQAPITPPVTPYNHGTQGQEAEQDLSNIPALRDSSPESTFRLPPAQTPASLMQNYVSMQQGKDDFDAMLKQNFGLPNAGLQIRTPLSPPRPENSYGVDTCSTYPLSFMKSQDVTMTNDPNGPKSPLSNSTNADGDHTPAILPITPSSHQKDIDHHNHHNASAGPTPPPPPHVNMAYLDNSYMRDNSFMMLQDPSATPSLSHMAMPSSLLAPYSGMQTDTSSWPSSLAPSSSSMVADHGQQPSNDGPQGWLFN